MSPSSLLSAWSSTFVSDVDEDEAWKFPLYDLVINYYLFFCYLSTWTRFSSATLIVNSTWSHLGQAQANCERLEFQVHCVHPHYSDLRNSSTVEIEYLIVYSYFELFSD